ncbi:MAG: hypothetical protein L0922_04390 [Candidatus Mariimomonas ferrooxydans]
MELWGGDSQIVICAGNRKKAILTPLNYPLFPLKQRKINISKDYSIKPV